MDKKDYIDLRVLKCQAKLYKRQETESGIEKEYESWKKSQTQVAKKGHLEKYHQKKNIRITQKSIQVSCNEPNFLIISERKSWKVI